MAIRIHRLLWRYRGERSVELKDIPVIAAQLHLVFCVLMLFGLVIA
jgi:hypothetical protein